MKLLALLEKQATAAAGTAVDLLTSPALQGRNDAVARIDVSADFNGQCKVQVSSDNSNWSDALVYPAAAGAEATPKMATVDLAGRYVRGNFSTRTAGTISIYLLLDK